MKYNSAFDLFLHLLKLDEANMYNNLTAIIDPEHLFFHEVLCLITAHNANIEQTVFSDLIHQASQQLTDDDRIFHLAGEQLDVYQLIKVIGQGGMGVVYLAKRIDGKLEQNVAIKILKPSISEVVGTALLLKEAQYLADIKHACIASIITVGSTKDGLPFMVMEYIDGIAIDRFCIENNLGLQERLKLFIKVLSAVSAAHNHLVIHADIKPSNILVTKQGEPKLMDFGISISTDKSKEKGQTRLLNSSGYLKALSKEFASPEQISGAPGSISGDIYSLGKLLQKLTLDINDNEVAAIISYATKELIDNRLPSIDIFTQALHSKISTQPILWYRKDFSYRYKKWFKRSPLSASVLTLFPLAVVVSATLLFLQNIELEDAATENKELLTFYETLLTNESSSISPSATLTAGALIKQGLKRALEVPLSSDETNQQIILTLSESLRTLGFADEALITLKETQINTPKSDLIRAKIAWHKRDYKQLEQFALRLIRIGGKYEYSGKIFLAQSYFLQNKSNQFWQVINEAKQYDVSNEQQVQRILIELEYQYLSTSTLSAETIKLLKQKAITDKNLVWLNAFMALNAALNKNNGDTGQFMQASLEQAENIYVAIHPDLAKLYLFLANVAKINKDGLNFEQLSLKALSIHQSLRPNYNFLIQKNFEEQYEYFLSHNMWAQARANLSLAKTVCQEYKTNNCSDLFYKEVIISTQIGDYEGVISSARSWLYENDELHQDFHYVLKLYLQSLIAVKHVDLDSVMLRYQSSMQSPESIVGYLNLNIQLGDVENALNVIYKEHETSLNHNSVKLAVANSYVAIGEKERAHVLIETLNSSRLNNADNLELSLIKQNILGNQGNTHHSNIFQLPQNNFIVSTRESSSIYSPKDNDELTIGKDFLVKWDHKSLPGKRVSLFINHIFNDSNNYQHWQHVKQSRWKLVSDSVPNNGSYKVDPYHFMANGQNKFKIMLATELGYWSLSKGLFSVRSGISKDNGLEHLIDPKLIADVIIHPKAYSAYTVGQKNSISWDQIKLGGELVALYVLHDNPKGIGDKLFVNVKTLHNKRWFMFAAGIPNTGDFTFDPALFNGRGSNYKILIVSNNGKWAVSEKRFSVINPL